VHAHGYLSLSPSGSFIGIGWGGVGYCVFDVTTGVRLALFTINTGRPILINDTQVLLAVMTGPTTRFARVVNFKTGATVAEFSVESIVLALSASADGHYVMAGTSNQVQIYDMEQKRVVWTKFLGQSFEDGQVAELTRGGDHVLLSRVPATSNGGITATQLINWKSNVEIGQWDANTTSGRLSPDSSFFVDGFDLTLYKVAIDWLATGVSSSDEAGHASITAEYSTGSIVLKQVPVAISALEWRLVDISGRQIASGVASRQGPIFRLSPQPLPPPGVYVLHCTSLSGVIGAWTVSLN